MDKNWIEKDFQHSGYWWSLKDKATFPGTILISDKKIFLDIVSLSQIDFGNYNEIILGQVSGTDITLHKVFKIKQEIFHAQKDIKEHKERYLVENIFWGKHFDIENNIKIVSLSTNYTHIQEWLSTPVFKHITNKHMLNSKRHGFTFKFHTFSNIFISKFQCTIKINSSLNEKWNPFKELNLKHSVYTEIKKDNPEHFEWFERINFNLQILLSLFVGFPLYQKNVKFVTGYRTLDKKEKTIVPEPNNSQICLWKNVFNFNPPQNKSSWDICLPYPLVKKHIERYVNKWFNSIDTLEAVYHLYFSILQEEIVSPNSFLNTIAALETFHKCAHMVNKSNLRTRLEDLIKKIEKIFYPHIEDKNKFVTDVINTRNYYTHYNYNLKSKALKGIELYHLTQKTKLLLQGSLLDYIGITRSKKCVESLSRVWRNQ